MNRSWIKQGVLFVSALSVMGLLAGCASNCVAINSQRYQTTSPTKKLGPKILRRTVSVSHVRSQEVNGFTQGQVTLTNLTQKIQPVHYQFIWMDSNGAPVGNNTPQTPVSLSPAMQRVVTTMAPTPQATHFQVQVCR